MRLPRPLPVWVYNGRVAWELPNRIGWLLAQGYYTPPPGWDAKLGGMPEGYSGTGPCGEQRRQTDSVRELE